MYRLSSSALNQAMSPHLSLRWDFGFLDAAQDSLQKAGRAEAGPE